MADFSRFFEENAFLGPFYRIFGNAGRQKGVKSPSLNAVVTLFLTIRKRSPPPNAMRTAACSFSGAPPALLATGPFGRCTMRV